VFLAVDNEAPVNPPAPRATDEAHPHAVAEVQHPDGTDTYAYDASGSQIQRNEDAVTYNQTVDGAGQLVAVQNTSNGENAIYVLGQTTFGTSTPATSQTGLRNPYGVAIDVGAARLFVADANNHRVMIFDVTSITNGEAAVNVLGQSSFTTANAATSQSGMRNPQGVVIDGDQDRLFVADTNNHRVTVFDVASITNGENAVNVLGQTTFTAGSAATAQNRMSSPTGVLLVVVPGTTIAYTYDPLCRLTAADYSGGLYFHYTYDAVGNRLTEVTPGGSVSYVYDIANRLTSVGGVTYTWSNNGNLLSDGVSTYTYSHANRLATAVEGGTTYAFIYNGQGDRLRQTENGSPTTYALDLHAGLTEVLSDGTNAYLYGNGRIAEEQSAGWVYHLGDALGSVRQLANPSGTVVMDQGYEPFGDVLTYSGTRTSIFQFSGQQVDGTGLVFLRARYLQPAVGRFLSRDVWEGNPNQPMSYNAWLYVYANPTAWTDHSGHAPEVQPVAETGYDAYNLTGWLVRTMRANSQSPEVAHIRELNQAAGPFLPDASRAAILALLRALSNPHVRGSLSCLIQQAETILREDPQRDRAYDEWEGLVGDRHRWDFKWGIQDQLGGDSIILCNQYHCPWFDSEVPGNVHYGFVGRAAGFDSLELHLAAGARQQQGLNAEFGTLAALLDDPYDFLAIEFGIGLFNRGGVGALAAELFMSVLPLYQGGFRSASPPAYPLGTSWPVDADLGPYYPVDHFNGSE